MLALFSFMAIIALPMWWIYALCEIIVTYLLDIHDKVSPFWWKYGTKEFQIALALLFVTVPTYAHLLLWWGGVK